MKHTHTRKQHFLRVVYMHLKIQPGLLGTCWTEDARVGEHLWGFKGGD